MEMYVHGGVDCRTQAKRSWTTAPTRIPVPPGTVVKRKRGGVLIADLTHPGW